MLYRSAKKYIKQFTRPSMVTFVERLMSEKLFFGKFVKICKKSNACANSISHVELSCCSLQYSMCQVRSLLWRLVGNELVVFIIIIIIIIVVVVVAYNHVFEKPILIS